VEKVTTIHGDSEGSIELLFASDEDAPKSAPKIVGAESGYACFDQSIQNVPDEERMPLLGLANAMRASEEGMWLATVDGSKRRLGIVQSNRGVAEGAGFYESNHGHSDGPVWRDFYYAATYHLLDQIDRDWSPEEIVFHHPTGYGWPPNLMPVVLEGVGNLLDSRSLAIERLIFSNGGCGLRDPREIADAAQVLAGDEQHGHRPIQAEEQSPEVLGYRGPAPVRLWKVDVLRDAD
jgi:hypothetical protein